MLVRFSLIALGCAVFFLISARWEQDKGPGGSDNFPDSLDVIDSLVQEAIKARAFPGAVVVVGTADKIVKMRGYGTFTYRSKKQVTPQSPFDMASLTKVIATTTAAMQLYEARRLDLDARVASYVPEFGQNGKENITIRHLLTHTSGMRPYIWFHEADFTTREEVVDSIFVTAPDNPPGKNYRYSDFSMIVLLVVIETITGQDFATYTHEHIFEPLGMVETGFRSTGIPDFSVVPTENDDYFRHRLIQGEVHDEAAWIMGGTSGHAGLFSTGSDVARFASMLVQGGRLNDGQFLHEETIRLFITAVDTSMHTRALGWDTRSPERDISAAGKFFGPRSYGHTGFTGTSFWIDPDEGLYVIFLSNRVYPSREGDYRTFADVRSAVADAAYEMVVGVPEDEME